MSPLLRLACLALSCLSCLLGPPARAQEDQRQEYADTNFESVMQLNEAPMAAPKAAAFGTDEDRSVELPEVPSMQDGEVEVPLRRYEALRAQLRAGEEAASRSYTSLVVLGESTYSGRAVEGGLQLKLVLRATLRGPGLWKSVPLVGEEVAIVAARAGGQPIALTIQNGYQVWVTDQTGEVAVELDLLVPARGPRGSLEYDFLVARTPVTRFDCLFPEAGLEPRLHRAVRADVSAEGEGTRLAAWLEPTSRIHLVGFKDLGAEEGRQARVYVETLSLLSVEESSADLFTVLRYNILHAGTNRFDIAIPAGLTVVSADGAGGFRYTLEPGAEGTVLRGETAFPIRDRYEVSLRLSRSLDGEPVDILPPRAVGAEREHGWLGVEALGSIQLAEVERAEALSVDVGQLPAELLGNAVSPVLLGWRYHSNGARIRLAATRLPQTEPVAGSIDEVVARTRLTAEGSATTELTITLRNRLRHSLRLRLPEGVVVRSSTLDGQPVRPSRDSEGALLLPLKRSAGDERPRPFTLTLLLESEGGRVGLFGLRTMQLPAFALPVSTLRWEVEAPAANVYSRLFGEVAPQGEEEALASVFRAASLPLNTTRYWLGADQPLTVRFAHLRGWLRAPLSLLGALGLVLLARGAGRRWEEWGRGGRLGAVAAFGGGALVLAWVAGDAALGVTLLAAALAAGLGGQARGLLRRLREALRRPAEGEPRPGSWRAYGFIGRAGLVLSTGFVLLLLLGGLLRLLDVLANPLG